MDSGTIGYCLYDKKSGKEAPKKSLIYVDNGVDWLNYSSMITKFFWAELRDLGTSYMGFKRVSYVINFVITI